MMTKVLEIFVENILTLEFIIRLCSFSFTMLGPSSQ